MTTALLQLHLFKRMERLRTALIIARARVTFILRYIDPAPAEFCNGWSPVAVGAFLLTHPATFDASLSYSVMARVAPAWVWGAALFVAGALQIVGVVFDTEGDFRRLRWIASGIIAWCWSFVSVALIRANPNVWGAFLYPMLMIVSLWLFVRLRSEALRG